MERVLQSAAEKVLLTQTKAAWLVLALLATTAEACGSDGSSSLDPGPDADAGSPPVDGGSQPADGGGGRGNGGSAGTGAAEPEVPAGPSCAGLASTCQGESCCMNVITGGTFLMGQGGANSSDLYLDPDLFPEERPEHEVTVDPFALDKYEVTVGRFRKFVDAYDGTPPAPDAGAHPAIDGSGWRSEWDVELAGTRTEFIDRLKCYGGRETWTDEVGTDEDKPINCVNWYEAFAFCAWDAGRLPTEAEWEYAAAGGSENRLYPWGSEAPTCELANWYGCPAIVDFVGSYPAGNGRWGHADLTGNVAEWTLDLYYGYGNLSLPHDNPANVTEGSARVLRGGSFDTRIIEGMDANGLRSTSRASRTPDLPDPEYGFRCARSPASE